MVEARKGRLPSQEGNNWHILIIRLARRLQLKVSRDERIESIKTDLIERRYRPDLVVHSQGEEAIIVNYCRSKLHILVKRQAR